jgi:transposase
VLHTIAPRRAKAVAEEVLGEHRPDVWVSDRYAGQQDLAPAHQVCLTHVLRDVQYTIDCGDTVFAPRLRELLRWAIRIGRRRDALRPASLATYHARAERRSTRSLPHPRRILPAVICKPRSRRGGRSSSSSSKIPGYRPPTTPASGKSAPP